MPPGGSLVFTSSARGNGGRRWASRLTGRPPGDDLFGWRRHQPGAGLGVSPGVAGLRGGAASWPETGDSLAQRNPMLLFRLSGVSLLRFVVRRLIGLLFQDPPRRTVARPRITARPGRWCRRGGARAPHPAAHEPSQFVHEPGGVLVLAHAAIPQIAREPEVGPQQRQLHVRRSEPLVGLPPGSHDRPVEAERRLLDPVREHEALLLREFCRARQEPLQQIVGFRIDRRVARENTRRASSASRRR
jgi:hypothetical protein